MFNFFSKQNDRNGDCYVITGSDCNHIKNVLRMSIGDNILVSDEGQSHLCKIESITDDTVFAKIVEENYNDTSLPINIYLFQGLPKADKMELIIQKCVELGVAGIIPTEMEHCVVKLDDKKKASKVARWQAISESAAKQSKRNIIPEIHNVLKLNDALEKAKDLDLLIVPYENEKGMKATKETLLKIKKGMNIGILIGAEGGFSQKEIDKCIAAGAEIISLGKRILRTETAAITAVAMCMLYSETVIDND
ncbi:MAG: 16S rRNA (uracil(1498)-N(3))-methyltransferase [Clostridia bacterium]|nr:16S rRNA (uracil(1498)-N(3))-methyltransferase [Clostridia bacterium]